MEHLDQFIGYLFTIEENNAPLSQEQFDKLRAIQGKVNDIVNKIQPSQSKSTQIQVARPVEQPQLQLQLAENKVHRFTEFQKQKR